MLWRKNGEPFWANYTASPLVRDGQLIGAVMTFVDVTEQRRTREKLEAAAQMRDRFTSVLGHDLRNPLSTVLMGAQQIARSDASDGIRRTANRLTRAAERMQRLVGDLLDLVRVREGGEILLRPRPTDLAVLAREIVSEFELAHPERRIVVETSGAVVGEWDADRLAQICSNLLSNAIRHGANDANVSMRVAATNDNATLTVENRGSPIPIEIRPHLFDPFRRGSTSGHGLGLGLFIVREVARAHGGDVAFTSDDERTAFTVRLPIERAALAS
jgi:signal transduction histidine kinase